MIYGRYYAYDILTSDKISRIPVVLLVISRFVFITNINDKVYKTGWLTEYTKIFNNFVHERF